MTQEQLDGLKRGDKIWIPGTVSHECEHVDWFIDVPGQRVVLDEDELLHLVELELPRPSAPEGYEEFWPESIFELDLGDYVGGARVVAKKPGAGEFRFSLGGRWLHFETTKALGVPFYRPIKKEPEVEPYTRETWRSVKDILPPPRTTILLWGYFDKEDAHCFDGQMFFGEDEKPVFHRSCMPANVSHWKPLPEAPARQGGAL